MGKKKDKFPKTLLAMKLDDGTIVVGEHVEEISEDFEGEPVGVYELRAMTKLTVEKRLDGKAIKNDRTIDLDSASHQEMASYVQQIGLKLSTRNMSTKALRKTLREYLERKAR